MAKLLEHCLSMMLKHGATSNAVRNATERTYVDVSKVEHSSHEANVRRGAARFSQFADETATASAARQAVSHA